MVKVSLSAAGSNSLPDCAAVIIAFSLLVAVPNYSFLLALALLFALFFSRQVKMAKRYTFGLTTFPVLLGTSTIVDKAAISNHYLRSGQILFVGLLTVTGFVLVERILLPRNYRKAVQNSLVQPI